MRTTGCLPPGSPRTAAVVLGPEDLPTVRGLAHDLVDLLLLRLRRSAGWWPRAARAASAAWAYGWRCVAQVTLVLLVSGGGAWLVWDGTAGQREQAPPSWSSQGSAEGTLEGTLEAAVVEADLTADLEVRRGDAPADRGAGPAEPAGGAAAAASSPSPLGGWLLSFAAVTGVLLAGAGAAVLVVRHHRRGSCATNDDDREPGVPDLADLLDLPDLPDLLQEPPGEDVDVVDRARTGDDGRDSDAEVLLATLAPTGAPGTCVPVVGGSVRTPFAAHSAVVLDGPVRSRVEARERLYERRACPRVDYVRPGVLVWRRTTCEMTVLDLSGTGLRLSVPPSSEVALPASGDHVHVEFPVDGGQVRIAAQVAWRRSTPEGTECGVVFRHVAPQDDARIRETCEVRA
jgi:hypothetical protein